MSADNTNLFRRASTAPVEEFALSVGATVAELERYGVTADTRWARFDSGDEEVPVARVTICDLDGTPLSHKDRPRTCDVGRERPNYSAIPKSWSAQGAMPVAWGLQFLRLPRPSGGVTAVVCEGEKDALALSVMLDRVCEARGDVRERWVVLGALGSGRLRNAAVLAAEHDLAVIVVADGEGPRVNKPDNTRNADLAAVQAVEDVVDMGGRAAALRPPDGADITDLVTHREANHDRLYTFLKTTALCLDDPGVAMPLLKAITHLGAATPTWSDDTASGRYRAALAANDDVTVDPRSEVLKSLHRMLGADEPGVELTKARAKVVTGDTTDALAEIRASIRLLSDYSGKLGSVDDAWRVALARGPTLVGLDFDAAVPEPVLWRYGPGRGRDPVVSVGEIAVLSGSGGVGKSTVALGLAYAAKPTGSEPSQSCGLVVASGPVVMLSYEDSAARISHRARWFSRDPADWTHLKIAANPNPLWAAEMAGRSRSGRTTTWGPFWAEVADLSPSLVIIDPVSVALAGVNANDGVAVREFLAAVSSEAARANCGVLLVAHDTKAARAALRAGEPVGEQRIAGSSQFFDGARGALYLSAAPPALTRFDAVLRCTKSNYGRAGWGIGLTNQTTEQGEWAGLGYERALTAVEEAALTGSTHKKTASTSKVVTTDITEDEDEVEFGNAMALSKDF